MSARRMTLVLGTAAAAFLAGGLTSLATLPVAHADNEADIFLPSNADSAAALALADPAAGIVFPGPDTGFISTIDPLLQMFGVTDLAAANPSEDFAAMVINIPSLGIVDVLTSGTESMDDLATAAAGLGLTLPDDIGLGMEGVTVNTFIDVMHPGLENLLSFTIPFEDPIADLWYFLVANDFFGL